MGIIVKKSPVLPTLAPLYTSALEKVKLIVGIGNPGSKYVNNRHNIGFMCLDELAKVYDASWQDKKDFKGHFTQFDLSGTRLLLIKPQTYVNLSGEAVSRIVQFYKLTPDNIFIIHDEIRHPFGTIEVFMGEKNFGHNGLKSIQNVIGENLQLIRVGIGPKKPDQINLTDFVLANFTDAQAEKLPLLTKEVSSIIGEASSGLLKPEKRSII